MSVCEEIADGAVACAKVLGDSGVMVRPQDWVEYYDAFAANLTDEDYDRFENARIATDVNHLSYSRIIPLDTEPCVRWWTRGHRFKLFGRPIFRMRSFEQNGVEHRSLWLWGRIPLMRKLIRKYTCSEM